MAQRYVFFATLWKRAENIFRYFGFAPQAADESYRDLLDYLSLRLAFFVVVTTATRQIDARMSRASFAALALGIPRSRQQTAKFGGIPMLAARNVDHSPKTKHDVGRKLDIVERIVIPVEVRRESREADAEQILGVTVLDPTEIAGRGTTLVKHVDKKTSRGLALG